MSKMKEDELQGRITQLEILTLQIFTPEVSARWLGEPKKFLDGLSPRQAVAEGHMEQVIERLEQYKNGFF